LRVPSFTGFLQLHAYRYSCGSVMSLLAAAIPVGLAVILLNDALMIMLRHNGVNDAFKRRRTESHAYRRPHGRLFMCPVWVD